MMLTMKMILSTVMCFCPSCFQYYIDFIYVDVSDEAKVDIAVDVSDDEGKFLYPAFLVWLWSNGISPAMPHALCPVLSACNRSKCLTYVKDVWLSPCS